MARGKSGGGHARSAVSGRYVTVKYANRSPQMTVIERTRSGSKASGARARSAISGRYVTMQHAKRSPNTTVIESS